MIHYDDKDVIITDINEIMTYEAAKHWNATVYRRATAKETKEFWDYYTYPD